ncbi:hypothetical protein OHD16_21490 [Sphingobacterium sp. ML3W]|uniref:hypothetical protein n=1 Tax=Sphingobacterium sp. ML3W TaxID=1538644 RepID=UPI00249B416C|nr:hypothetical protein [Sphingobacterium sp. ML3W]WFA77306.1 hypothetical protein OGI71_14630 [Sphingobacterium sp. ML3W]
MAKVKEIKINVDGVDHCYNVNVNKDGVFKIHLDWAVSDKIGLKGNLFEGKDLSKIESEIISATIAYRESKKVLSLWIEIHYSATGFYSCEDFGKRKFDSKFSSVADIPMLGLDYMVLIKEELNGGESVNWYYARKIEQHDIELKESGVNLFKKEYANYIENRQYHGRVKDTTIPFSESAIETLDKAKSGIKSISQILLKVLSQEPEQIESTLVKNKLLI